MALRLGDSVEAKVKHSLSRGHFSAARYFVEKASLLESEWAEDQSVREKISGPHRAYVTSAVMLAVAGLEASVNELYLEAIDKNEKKLGGLNGKSAQLMGEFWEEIERFSILKKYDLTLTIAGAHGFEKGERRYQDADSLIRLRNALVHYKPEWDHETQVHQNLEARLAGKFSLCPFHGPNSLWFPHQCLGAGCALWALESAEGFLNEFCQRAKIPARLD